MSTTNSIIHVELPCLSTQKQGSTFIVSDHLREMIVNGVSVMPGERAVCEARLRHDSETLEWMVTKEVKS